VLITRRGRPMAQLVPPGLVAPGTGLRDVKGWLEEDDPFLEAVASIVASRRQHVPRVLRRRRGRR
jgi:antitoxin (DNA-binding transcriptional repressor) of toxin-antitoxin stability system